MQETTRDMQYCIVRIMNGQESYIIAKSCAAREKKQVVIKPYEPNST